MVGPRVVLDTNVLVAASRSARGASAKLLSLVGTGIFEICISVPLVIEYEDVLLRGLEADSTKRRAMDALLDYLCAVAHQQKVFFLWRPRLRDPKDDMVLELAVAARCDTVVTYNKRDFGDLGRFRPNVLSPREFLVSIGALP